MKNTCGGCLFITPNATNNHYHCSKSGYNISNTFERSDICKEDNWKITMKNIKIIDIYQNEAEIVGVYNV